MKKYAVIFCLVVFCLSFSAISTFGQSNRGGQKATKKANKRKPETTKEKPKFANKNENEVIETLETDDDIISIDTNLVTIPVRVLDRDGRFVSGLKKEDFKVFEDKQPQEVAYFTNEQKPFTVALVLDMSYSSTFKIDEIQQAALQFVTELRPSDKVMVLSFDEELHVLCEPTNNRKVINNAIIRTRISTGTSLYEAVDFVINKRFNKIEGRKAIVLFTDGVDTTSRSSNDRRNLRDASEFDALIYPIHYDTFEDVQAIESGKIRIKDPNSLPQTTPPIGGGGIPTGRPTSPIPFPLPTGTIGGRRTSRNDPRDQRIPGRTNDPTDPRNTRTQTSRLPSGSGTTKEEYERAEKYLDEMALRTGGRVYEATSADTLTRAFSKIASELREFYSLGYYPSEDKKAGKRRKIKVKVNRKKVAVKARSSYIVKKKNKNKSSK